MMTYDKQGLDLDRIRAIAPSVFATRPYYEVSDKYRFIPTVTILEELLSRGFVCVGAGQTNAKAGKLDFTHHSLRFRIPTGVTRWEVGDIYPEVMVSNAHDRTGTYRALAAFMRVWCSNQCAAPIGKNSEIRTRHVGDVGEVIDATYRVIEDMPMVADSIKRWQQIPLDYDRKMAFARSAALLRWDEDKVPVQPAELLRSKRPQDNGDDLFTTYQRVQEHLITGGDRGRSTTRSRRRMRTQPVKSVLEDTRINKALWSLTSEMEKLVAG